jgi:hypothetical protein
VGGSGVVLRPQGGVGVGKPDCPLSASEAGKPYRFGFPIRFEDRWRRIGLSFWLQRRKYWTLERCAWAVVGEPINMLRAWPKELRPAHPPLPLRQGRARGMIPKLKGPGWCINGGRVRRFDFEQRWAVRFDCGLLRDGSVRRWRPKGENGGADGRWGSLISTGRTLHLGVDCEMIVSRPN